jgi:RNA polymerase sigma-70 factor (ECF subfamily)
MANRAPIAFDDPDELLVRRFQETGDSACFEALFVRHRLRVYSSCRRFFTNNDLAEDATQETFIRVYQNMQRFHDGEFLHWLMRIAKNVCIDMWRKQRPERQIATEESVEAMVSPAPDADSDLYLATQRLRDEMLALPDDQRRCLEMKIEGYSYQETADRTGLSVDAVKSHLQNGRRMLWLKMEGMLSQLR